MFVIDRSFNNFSDVFFFWLKIRSMFSFSFSFGVYVCAFHFQFVYNNLRVENVDEMLSSSEHKLFTIWENRSKRQK